MKRASNLPTNQPATWLRLAATDTKRVLPTPKMLNSVHCEPHARCKVPSSQPANQPTSDSDRCRFICIRVWCRDNGKQETLFHGTNCGPMYRVVCACVCVCKEKTRKFKSCTEAKWIVTGAIDQPRNSLKISSALGQAQWACWIWIAVAFLPWE